MKVTLATLKEILRRNPDLERLSSYAINQVVSCFVDEVFTQVTIGNTVAISGLMSIQPRIKQSKLHFDVNLREVKKSEERYSPRVVLSRKLTLAVAQLPLPTQVAKGKVAKRKVSKK